MVVNKHVVRLFFKSLSRKWYYVGSTNSLERRLSEHNSGKVQSTKGFKPFVLVFSKQFSSETESRLYERLLKNKRTEKENILKNIN